MYNAQRKYKAYILLLLYVGYFSAVSIFIHPHIYNNIVYLHSHPYKKSEKQLPFDTDHHHSASFFYTLNQVSSILSSEGKSLHLKPIIISFSLFEYKDYAFPQIQLSNFRALSLRAPPF